MYLLVVVQGMIQKSIVTLFEPRHEKICFCHMRTTKAQISLLIRAVWSAHLLFAAYIVWYL